MKVARIDARNGMGLVIEGELAEGRSRIESKGVEQARIPRQVRHGGAMPGAAEADAGPARPPGRRLLWRSD